MSQKQQFDIVVIGAGSAGLTAAVGFAKVGKSVLLVERGHMGGECTNSGCIPSKALLYHAKQFHTATQIAGESAKGEAFRAEAFTYVQTIINDIVAEETPETFEQFGITVIKGEARFSSQCAITIGETKYQYKQAVIATGSAPRMIDIPGISSERLLTNQNLFTLSAIPERLLIIGGGPIGLEMAQAFAMLGSAVTIVERGDELARLEDPAIRTVLKQKFADLGITVETNATLQEVAGETTAHFIRDTGDTFAATFDKLLVAIGRIPVLPQGLDEAGIKSSEHGITVDTQYRTTNKYVYAIGDVSQQAKFTHTADNAARQVVERVVSKGWLRVNSKQAIPKVTYTQPEIAQVGMLETEALEKYGAERIMRIDVPYTLNDRAKTDGETDGHLVVIARRLNGVILGANLIGPAAGEILSVFTVAIDRKISLWNLRRIMFAYPSYSLVIKKAGDLFFAEQIASLRADIGHVLKRHAPKVIAAVVWIALVWSLSAYQNATGMTPTETALMLFSFISMTVWGPLLYIGFYAVRPLIFFPAAVLTILAGIFFGLFWGTVYTIIAATLSAIVAYSVGRFFGTNLQLEDSVVGNWVEGLRKNTFEATLVTRLLFLPYDLIGYLAGILNVRLAPFVLATILGIILGTTTFVSIGASLDLTAFIENGFSADIIEPRYLLISLAIFIISLTLSRTLRRPHRSS